MSKFCFTKQERIKSKKLYEETFLFGKRIDSKNRFIRCSFLINESEQKFLKVAFSVGKRHGNAVWRNRVKRILREIYRINNLPIKELIKNTKFSVSIIFMINKLNHNSHSKVSYSLLEPELKFLLSLIFKELEKT